MHVSYTDIPADALVVPAATYHAARSEQIPVYPGGKLRMMPPAAALKRTRT